MGNGYERGLRGFGEGWICGVVEKGGDWFGTSDLIHTKGSMDGSAGCSPERQKGSGTIVGKLMHLYIVY